MFKIVLCLSGLLLVAANLEDHEDVASVCDASDDRGLHRLMLGSIALMNTTKLQNILSNAAAYDPEVRKLRKLMRSADFKKKLEILNYTDERCDLFAYICRRLHMEYDRYIAFVRVFMNIHTTKKPTTSAIANARPGILGLLQDLTDALPRQKIRQLYLRLVEEDCELGTTVRRIRSERYQQLLSNFRTSEEYSDVYDTLVCAGVPMKALKRLINTAFGWKNVDAGVEKSIWYV